ncbi:MAG TPA: lipoate--protein ligase [Sphaerochaeta sp.]|nr:lipoate--protein ligase [Sphaerochaeta sp.]
MDRTEKRAIIISTSHDCAANLAGEALLIEAEYDRVLYLWENDPCIVVGRYQNAWAECNLQKMREDNVQLVRRQSGGGAVYHDRGNLIFTFIENKETASEEENFDLLIAALARVGVTAEHSGRNDVTMDGKKISGNAFQKTRTKFCHHGTLLVHGDLLVMDDYLTPSSTKLASKAVQSVAARVGNLSEQVPSITISQVKEAFIEEFIARYGESEIIAIDYSSDPAAQERYDLFGNYDSILKRSPPFSHQISHRFNWGEVTVELLVRAAVIERATIYSDALDTTFLPIAQAALQGVAYAKEALGEAAHHQEHPLAAELLRYIAEDI